MLKQTRPRELNGLTLRQLRTDLGTGKFPKAVEELLRKPDETALAVVGLASTMLGVATDPVGAATLMGLAASAYPIGKGLMRQLGFAPSDFTGPQWPFLYSYGTRAKRRQLTNFATSWTSSTGGSRRHSNPCGQGPARPRGKPQLAVRPHGLWYFVTRCAKQHVGNTPGQRHPFGVRPC